VLRLVVLSVYQHLGSVAQSWQEHVMLQIMALFKVNRENFGENNPVLVSERAKEPEA
jgi:hypothetical protein